MNFLCNINRSFLDLVINYLNLRKERSSCSDVFCKKGVPRNFSEIFNSTFFQRILLVAPSDRVNADDVALLCSVAFGKEKNISGEA